jgi:geranylgeranyl diphosphate synthase type I
VDRLALPLRRVAVYHFGWSDEQGRPLEVAGGGKYLRPTLVLLSALAANGSCADAVPAAVAVELVHNFSLLHDDVMDGDTERRHRPTAWTVYGTSEAVLAGDALLALATDVLLDTPGERWELRYLNAAVTQLISGQVEDIRFEQRCDVSVDDCLAMAAGKTAALLACASSIGAVAVGGPGRIAVGLADFGAHLGLAFQLVDDLLGIWGDPQVTGKPVLADLRAGKMSAPVVAALCSGSPHAETLRELYVGQRLDDEADIVLAAKLVDAAGGRDWVTAEADRQLSAALGCLDSLALPESVQAELVELARFVTARDC